MTAPAVAWVGSGKVITGQTLTAAWLAGPSASAPTLTANTTFFIEQTQSLSEKTSNTAKDGYTVNTTDVIGEPFDFSATGGHFGQHIFAWITAYESQDTLAAGGFRLLVADDLATDSVGSWYCGPQDGFLGGWASYVVNPSAAFDAVTAGTATWTVGGNPAQLSGVDGFGAGWKITKSITGNVDNTFVDSISVGYGYRLTLGDAGSAEGKFADFITQERTTGATGRYGGLRGVGGVLFMKSRLYIGADTGSTNTEFIDSGFTVVWEKTTLSDGTSSSVASDFYALICEEGTGTTDVTLSNGSFTAIAPHEVYVDFSGVNSVSLTNIVLNRARLIDLDGAVTWNGGTIVDSGTIDLGGEPTLDAIAIIDPTDGFAMEVNAVTEVDSSSNISFDGAGVGGSGNGAVYINISGAGPFALTFDNFTYANRVSGSHDIVIAANSNADYTITVTGGGSTPTINNLGSGTVTLVVGAVDFTVHVQDVVTEASITGARVWVPVTSTAGGYPFDSSITGITRTSSTATATFAAPHGLATSDFIYIEGVTNEDEYNGTHSITATPTTTTIEFTVDSGATTPATGTILGTFVVISGTTDGSGNITKSKSYSASQPISGRVRTATGAGPYYKTAPISGTISSSAGLSLVVQLIPDS